MLTEECESRLLLRGRAHLVSSFEAHSALLVRAVNGGSLEGVMIEVTEYLGG